MRISTALFVLLLVLLQYRLWFGNGSMTEVHHLENQISQMEEKNQQLKERNLSLTAEVLDLKEGKEAIEERSNSDRIAINYQSISC